MATSYVVLIIHLILSAREAEDTVCILALPVERIEFSDFGDHGAEPVEAVNCF